MWIRERKRKRKEQRKGKRKKRKKEKDKRILARKMKNTIHFPPFHFFLTQTTVGYSQKKRKKERNEMKCHQMNERLKVKTVAFLTGESCSIEVSTSPIESSALLTSFMKWM